MNPLFREYICKNKIKTYIAIIVILATNVFSDNNEYQINDLKKDIKNSSKTKNTNIENIKLEIALLYFQNKQYHNSLFWCKELQNERANFLKGELYSKYLDEKNIDKALVFYRLASQSGYLSADIEIAYTLLAYKTSKKLDKSPEIILKECYIIASKEGNNKLMKRILEICDLFGLKYRN